MIQLHDTQLPPKNQRFWALVHKYFSGSHWNQPSHKRDFIIGHDNLFDLYLKPPFVKLFPVHLDTDSGDQIRFPNRAAHAAVSPPALVPVPARPCLVPFPPVASQRPPGHGLAALAAEDLPVKEMSAAVMVPRSAVDVFSSFHELLLDGIPGQPVNHRLMVIHKAVALERGPFVRLFGEEVLRRSFLEHLVPDVHLVAEDVEHSLVRQRFAAPARHAEGIQIISEKLFRSDKTFIGSKSKRVQSSQSMSSKIFIEFVALIVRNRIYNLLKEQMLRMDTRQKYMTVPAAIRELEKIEMVRRSGGSYKLDHAVTKTQKIILSSFGLDETNIKDSAEEISKLLATSQSLISRKESDDGEEEIN